MAFAMLNCEDLEFSLKGTPPIPVPGIKGGNATLSCEFEDHEISVIALIRRSKNILVCKNEECKSENGKVFKKGSCDIVLKDLSYSDAGTYILKVYYKNNQTEVDKQVMEYNLHIQDEISVKTGEKVKLDVLLTSADKVQHQNSNSTEWTEVWTRGDEVQSNRLNVNDGNLIISWFTANDTGTYRVLDSNNEILITVTVTITESSDESKGKPNDTEQHTVESRIIVPSVIGPLLVLLVLVISAVIWKHKRQNRNTEHASTEVIPKPEPENIEALVLTQAGQSTAEPGADLNLIDLWSTDPIPTQVLTLESSSSLPVPSGYLDAPPTPWIRWHHWYRQAHQLCPSRSRCATLLPRLGLHIHQLSLRPSPRRHFGPPGLRLHHNPSACHHRLGSSLPPLLHGQSVRMLRWAHSPLQVGLRRSTPSCRHGLPGFHLHRNPAPLQCHRAPPFLLPPRRALSPIVTPVI
ncbi:hypothetical protein DPX16_1088 [Anabarilius grahami]|uniref:Immunoglobulin domain-containing protein n=1 Tax=Anabarilius grahami TaxID=495550 RepID=A0A3N0YCX3_ANAGA|nr:hypothetical protein DPX16_1088 [Anabarilius grahami]